MPDFEVDPAVAKEILERFLDFYTRPSFGSPAKRDIDIEVFGILYRLGYVTGRLSLFEVAQRLRITPAKARSLLFDHDVRGAAASAMSADQLIKATLAGLRFTKDGDYFVCEVESPYAQALVRDRIRQLGFISDTSFNSSLIRLSADAATALIGSVLSTEEKAAVTAALIKAGAPDKSFPGVVKGALKALAVKFGGDALGKVSDDVADVAGDLMKPIIEGAADQIASAAGKWTDIFKTA